MSLTLLGMVGVLPQVGILYIQEPKGLNFKGGEKQRMTFVKFPFPLLISPHFSLLSTALL